MEKTKKTKKRLGRGIEGLLKVSAANDKKSPEKIELKSPKQNTKQEDVVQSLEITKVYPNKNQPRKHFDETALNELAASIKEQGIMQPITVNQKPNGEYEIIAGERRWRAAQLAKLKKIPALVKSVDAQKTLELAIIENIQRDDLNPIEEAEAYARLAKEHGLKQQDIAEKVGKDRATVANLLRITKLGTEVKKLVAESKISLGHAKVLLAIDKPAEQKKLADKVVRLNLSVRATESMVKNHLNPQETETTAQLSAEYKSLEDKLRKCLGTKTQIMDKKGKGKLVIHYHSLKQLNEIYEKITDM